MKQLFSFLGVVLLLPFSVHAFNTNEGLHQLAVGQGISSPSSFSLLYFSSGFTQENPVGAAYQNGFRLSGQLSQNGSSVFGGEIGGGTGNWGMAVGYKEADCSTCDGNASGALGILSSSTFGVGVRFEDNVFSLGTIINPTSSHRFGIMAEHTDFEDTSSDFSEFGVGYSWVSRSVTFTMDASKKYSQGSTDNDNTVLLTPGLSVNTQMVQISLNYDKYVNNEEQNTASSGNDNFWLGMGIGKKDWHISLYSDYVQEIAVNASLLF